MSEIVQKEEKLDYLKAKYVFRYPFTIKALKWGIAIGLFIGLHSFIKNRSAKKSFQSVIWGTFMSSFPIWAFFMAKYNFYQNSISEYQKDETQRIQLAEAFKNLMYYKLKLPPDLQLSQQQLLQKYNQQLQKVFQRNSQLDSLLTGITSKTFD